MKSTSAALQIAWPRAVQDEAKSGEPVIMLSCFKAAFRARSLHCDLGLKRGSELPLLYE